uniref:RGS domain-containing protein n=1 Tax=Caenorhabditis tropicalis TaxID=1561998 RepID=A0A1I7UX12_9PELO
MLKCCSSCCCPSNSSKVVPFGNVATQEDVANWSLCFATLMNSKVGRYHFKRFLTKERADEYLSFWEEVEELKKTVNQTEIENKIMFIYETYIQSHTHHEISISGAERIKINNALKAEEFIASIFNNVQLEIYRVMEKDIYIRFCKSPEYQGLLH